MISFEEYKKRLELETITIFNVTLDVYFSYTEDFGFTIEAIEDVTGTQDLTPILGDSIIDKVEKELVEIYRKQGLL